MRYLENPPNPWLTHSVEWLGEPPETGRHYLLQTAALCVLGYEHADPVIRRWNQPATA